MWRNMTYDVRNSSERVDESSAQCGFVGDRIEGTPERYKHFDDNADGRRFRHVLAAFSYAEDERAYGLQDFVIDLFGGTKGPSKLRDSCSASAVGDDGRYY
ncbi:hypothetical protein HBI56_179730 [Parastagonospora nodorum]|uniref:Uncharacterized protein n=1 Tax=Phaeosphaeria nodorum (strain SN15 / ATCC MYA-4574 / FGSC 10173) TaxID=321614 RepID=A0A7U2I477_PHANO|nr:hypothetical protein HBH56_185160 [Parastagonospora nodorum]QRD01129.1 hypothetical protein JI435_152770 [Parastagonospora nodorum SN15]KAH3925296.1 hypothetical protein HBH54_183410 [Parastagonospora nodorum]KAH3940647.1 hypothetical protein HBH53_214970 [Parastagonospora nodorum]KAH3958222.1 hypothetical protein HBH51_211400 [Parastagonospora nodorum]